MSTLVHVLREYLDRPAHYECITPHVHNAWSSSCLTWSPEHAGANFIHVNDTRHTVNPLAKLKQNCVFQNHSSAVIVANGIVIFVTDTKSWDDMGHLLS